MGILVQQHDSDIVIIQITDTHLMEHPDHEFIQINPEQNFHAVMNDVLQRYPKIDAILHTGDLAQVAVPATYQRYMEYMERLNIPFFNIPGNHDDLRHFPIQTALPEPTVLEFKHWTIILLNSAVEGQTDGKIQAEQLQRLPSLLNQYHNKSVLLACHHHPFEMQSHWIDQHKLKNATELLEILKPFENVKALICGHVHQDSNTLWNQIQFISTPATCVQFKPLSDDFALDSVAPGYRCLHLKENGQLETILHRLENYNFTINEEISGY